MKWRWSFEELAKPAKTSWIKYFARTWCKATCWSLSGYLPTFHCTSKAMVHFSTSTADIHSLANIDRYMTCARFIWDSKCVADWNICMSFTSVYIDSSSELRSIGHCIDALLCEVSVRPCLVSHPMVELFSSCMNSFDWVNTLSSWEKVIIFEIFALHCKFVKVWL